MDKWMDGWMDEWTNPLFPKCQKPNLKYLGLRRKYNGFHSHPSARMGTPGRETRNRTLPESLSSTLVCASLFGSTVSADFLHTDKTVDVSSPRITYFFLFLLSTCSSPKSSLKDPREAFRLAQFGSHGHTLVSVAQRVRG